MSEELLNEIVEIKDCFIDKICTLDDWKDLCDNSASEYVKQLKEEIKKLEDAE